MSNETRAQRGMVIMSAIRDLYQDDDDWDNLVDALTDLLHAEVVDPETLEAITRIAIDHYEDEVCQRTASTGGKTGDPQT